MVMWAQHPRAGGGGVTRIARLLLWELFWRTEYVQVCVWSLLSSTVFLCTFPYVFMFLFQCIKTVYVYVSA